MTREEIQVETRNNSGLISSSSVIRYCFEFRISIFGFVAFFLLLPARLSADEIHSNGLGGGLWSDPASWRKKKVPGPEDEAVISRGDVIVFDRNDDGEKITCKQMSIDPRGGLIFKRGGGKLTMTVGGLIESFGTIKLQANDKADDRFELRLLAETPDKRMLKLQKGGALLAYGRPIKSNVILTSLAPKPKDAKMPPLDPLGAIDSTEGVMIDLKHATIVDIDVRAQRIDNTGAKPNERINVVGCTFLEKARLYIAGCDTPLIADNTFDSGKHNLAVNAIGLYSSPLAEVRNNKIKGTYSSGISGTAQTDSVVIGNVIEKCSNGVYWYGTNGMIKQTLIRECSVGVVLTSANSCVIEDVVVENCQTGYNHAGASAQLNNFQYKNPPKNVKDLAPVLFGSGPLTMVNCAFSPKDVKLPAKFEPIKSDGPPVNQIESMQYLILGIKGKIPPNTMVDVRTTNPAVKLPPGAADLNIRNSPAMLFKGFTPLPRSLEPIVVRSWSVNNGGQLVPAPTYTVRVLDPAVKETPEGRLLKSLTVTPSEAWARPDPNELKATLEVTIP